MSHVIPRNFEMESLDIDESEIDRYILSEPEARIKMDKWLERNREHLEEQDRRRKLKEEKAEEEKDKPKRKIPNRKKKEPIIAETHIEAIQQVLEVGY